MISALRPLSAIIRTAGLAFSGALSLLAVLFVASSARADLVFIEYYDQGHVSPDTSGGPLWTGVVDTVTNNLRIDSWMELPAHGADFWVPRNLPLIWTARDTSGNVYDVPDSFGTTVVPATEEHDSYTTAEIGTNFAFISSDTVGQMEWEDMDGNPQNFGTIYPPTRVGWGGYAQIVEHGGEFLYLVDGDEMTMPRLPVDDENMLASTDAVVRVTDRQSNPDGVIAAVPETASLVRFTLIAATLALTGLNARRSLAKNIGAG